MDQFLFKCYLKIIYIYIYIYIYLKLNIKIKFRKIKFFLYNDYRQLKLKSNSIYYSNINYLLEMSIYY